MILEVLKSISLKTKDGPKVFEPGQTLKIDSAKAGPLIEQGYLRPVSEKKLNPLPNLCPKNAVLFSKCSLCQDRHIIGSNCPEKSKDWMNIEGNRVVRAISVNLDIWALTDLNHDILEAIERFNEAWEKRDTETFKEVVTKIDNLLIGAGQ